MEFRAATSILLVVFAWSMSAVAAQTRGIDAQEAPGAQADIATPSHDEVAARAIKALGGQDAIDRIQSVYMKIAMSAPDPKGTREIFWSRDNGLVVKLSIQGFEAEQGIVGSTGWQLDPSGRTALLPEAVLKESRRSTTQYLFALGIEKFADFGYTRLDADHEVAGQINGKPTHKLVYGDGKSGQTTIHHDAESGLPIAIEHVRTRDSLTVTTTFDGWEEIDGVLFFRSGIVNAKPPEGELPPPTKLDFETIEVNRVDPDRFALPEEVKALLTNQDQDLEVEGEIAFEDLSPESQKEATERIEALKAEGPESVRAFIEQNMPMVDELADGPQKDMLRYILQELRKEIQGG